MPLTFDDKRIRARKTAAIFFATDALKLAVTGLYTYYSSDINPSTPNWLTFWQIVVILPGILLETAASCGLFFAASKQRIESIPRVCRTLVILWICAVLLNIIIEVVFIFVIGDIMNALLSSMVCIFGLVCIYIVTPFFLELWKISGQVQEVSVRPSFSTRSAQPTVDQARAFIEQNEKEFQESVEMARMVALFELAFVIELIPLTLVVLMLLPLYSVVIGVMCVAALVYALELCMATILWNTTDAERIQSSPKWARWRLLLWLGKSILLVVAELISMIVVPLLTFAMAMTPFIFLLVLILPRILVVMVLFSKVQEIVVGTSGPHVHMHFVGPSGSVMTSETRDSEIAELKESKNHARDFASQ